MQLNDKYLFSLSYLNALMSFKKLETRQSPVIYLVNYFLHFVLTLTFIALWNVSQGCHDLYPRYISFKVVVTFMALFYRICRRYFNLVFTV